MAVRAGGGSSARRGGEETQAAARAPIRAGDQQRRRRGATGGEAEPDGGPARLRPEDLPGAELRRPQPDPPEAVRTYPFTFTL